ncbi:MAG: queuosine precursor transporter [Candidatus Saccharimonadales bacterium]
MTLVSVSTMLLIVSNLASVKITQVGPAVFDAGTLIFPLVYIITSIITEIYGPKVARTMVWIGFGCLVFMSLFLLGVQYLPADLAASRQSAYEQILGFVPRLAVASLIAYLIGESINIGAVQRLKRHVGPRSLWTRLVGSSAVGGLVDTVVFSVIAFAGTMPTSVLLQLIVTVYVIKLAVDISLSPLTVKFTAWLRTLRDEPLTA